MINVILTGALGRMGRMVAAELEGDPGTRISGAVESPGHPGVGSVFRLADPFPMVIKAAKGSRNRLARRVAR